MPEDSHPLINQIKEACQLVEAVKQEIGKVIIGQTQLVESLLISLLVKGHILLEGVPGIAKTLAANTLARTIQCDFKRVQFTPDLLPADLIGTTIFNSKDNTFEVKKGPIFTNILLADEINRAPSKVQSALLEIMQENQVTIGDKTYQAPSPFLVIATQNPVEQEGTYPLSEAQTDRFCMKIKLTYPSKADEKQLLQRVSGFDALSSIKPILKIEQIFQLRQLVESIYIDNRLIDYLLDIIQATRSPKLFELPLEHLLEYGASPRATIALQKISKARALLAGRYFVTPQDIKDSALSVLRHRLHLTYEAEAENLTSDHLIDQILQTLDVP